ncbi:uncharacterized protein F4807DRAFT_463961 [Annulohypoxylon truncatum]|uniref:uncharacterized protein n=1 Tax=Annulohypoxylon truncatum TaxID=327061 RepID=UPI0020089B08|nr:uncharacterized protein F4807DRAFT_463961 [Annulohypoxylon truncatum]KAI1206196.1 hypothetical protein F4807DRAFT_463961 [Annulohypoxylon truncatum]
MHRPVAPNTCVSSLSGRKWVQGDEDEAIPKLADTSIPANANQLVASRQTMGGKSCNVIANFKIIRRRIIFSWTDRVRVDGFGTNQVHWVLGLNDERVDRVEKGKRLKSIQSKFKEISIIREVVNSVVLGKRLVYYLAQLPNGCFLRVAVRSIYDAVGLCDLSARSIRSSNGTIGGTIDDPSGEATPFVVVGTFGSCAAE